MARSTFIVWAAATWITPAIVGGVVGWPGIWGGGSAFGDLILPVPITGGIIHVPTFIAAIVLAKVYPGLPASLASVVRAALAGAALVGLAHLVDLERIYLSYSTDLAFRRIPWDRDYFGLCLMTDALWTLVLTLGRPALRTLWLPAMALIAVPPVAYVYVAIEGNERLRQPFVLGRSQSMPSRGDAVRYVFIRLDVAESGFRERARSFVEEHGPESSVNAEAIAIYFTDSLQTAKSRRSDGRILLTLCLYEDGTAARWEDGQADCFSGHESFTERRDALHARAPGDVPADVWGFAVQEALCADVTIPDAYADGIAAVRHCRGVDLAAMRRALESSYGVAELDTLLQRARGDITR